MKVIKLDNPNKLPPHENLRGYPGGSIEDAISAYFARYQKAPEVVYVLDMKTTKNIFCEVPK